VGFSSQSDTEVLLKLFMQRGPGCLRDLRGMFAFAVWDRRRRRLFLARDRVGEKPLVYSQQSGAFVFASEIQALLALPWLPREIDPVGLHYGLYYVAVPAPHSAFKNVRKVRPGEWLMVTPDGVSSDIYWRPRYSGREVLKDRDECLEAVNACLNDTVKIMARSDVPVGAMLSGGIDSSAVVASLAGHLPRLETFCIGYEAAPEGGELGPAQVVADRFGTQHRAMTFGAQDVSSLADVVRAYAEPVAAFGPMHAHAISAQIGRRVKVALTGSGGDELYGGYDDHRRLLDLERWWRVRRFLDRWGMGKAAASLPLRGLRELTSLGGQASLGRQAAWLRFSAVHNFCEAVYSPRMKELCRGCDPSDLYVEAYESFASPRVLDNFMFQQLSLGSQHTLVDIPDISGMAHSLEYRSPFLDVRMIELAARIPAGFKVAPGQHVSGGKRILRDVLRDRLPPEIVEMRKAGFGSSIPYGRWMLTEWAELVTAKLESQALQDTGLFNSEALIAMFLAAQHARPVSLEHLWGLVTIGQWLEEFF
jgi:asparagine synthase (glutamine-hydrolysing)